MSATEVRHDRHELFQPIQSLHGRRQHLHQLPSQNTASSTELRVVLSLSKDEHPEIGSG
jgi:hypothetical protein